MYSHKLFIISQFRLIQHFWGDCFARQATAGFTFQSQAVKSYETHLYNT